MSPTAQLACATGGEPGLVRLRNVLQDRERGDHIKRLAGRHRRWKGTPDVPVLRGAWRYRVEVDPHAHAHPAIEDPEQRTVGACDVEDPRSLGDVRQDPARSLPLKSVVKPLHRSRSRAPYHARSVPTPSSAADSRHPRPEPRKGWRG